MDVINSFRDEYSFLSNFYEAPVTYNGLTYSTSEAAYQAQKTLDEAERMTFTTMTPGKAKQAGKHVTLRPDWNDVKFSVMEEIVRAKFTQNKDLGDKLVATGNIELEEGNTWGDRIWGTVDGVGQNALGKTLMKIREELRLESFETAAKKLSENNSSTQI